MFSVSILLMYNRPLGIMGATYSPISGFALHRHRCNIWERSVERMTDHSYKASSLGYLII